MVRQSHFYIIGMNKGQRFVLSAPSIFIQPNDDMKSTVELFALSTSGTESEEAATASISLGADDIAKGDQV